MCWSLNIAASGIQPDIRHGASVSKKEVKKQNKIGDCRIKAHALISSLPEYFLCHSGATYHASPPSSLQPSNLSGGGWSARWKPQVVTKLWLLTGDPQNLRWVRTQTHTSVEHPGVAHVHQILTGSRALSGPEGQSCWICSPSASNPINLRAGLFSGETLSSHLNIYGRPGNDCQPHSSRLPSTPFLYIPSRSSYPLIHCLPQEVFPRPMLLCVTTTVSAAKRKSSGWGCCRMPIRNFSVCSQCAARSNPP